jgi:hypothetical protein
MVEVDVADGDLTFKKAAAPAEPEEAVVAGSAVA